jgi:hypothetical protein
MPFFPRKKKKKQTLQMIKLGEEFASSKAESLRQMLNDRSLAYFQTYHRSKMEVRGCVA